MEVRVRTGAATGPAENQSRQWELGEEEEMVANISKHGAIKDLNEKIRRPRQAEGGDHSGDPLDWLRASVPGEPGQDYPVLSAIQVDIVIMIFLITNVIKAFTFQP